MAGKAVSLDPLKKTVRVELRDAEAGMVINYSTLILATGSKSNSPLWFMNDHQEVVKNKYEELQASLAKSETVLIAGGGAVGVETAAEIGFYLKKRITVLSGGERLLPRHPAGNASTAESKLKDLGVETIHNLRSLSSRKLDDGCTEVTLSDGSTRKFDIFIDATGTTPNSAFIPAAWLNASGKVTCDDKSFRVIGAPNVYVFGDLASCSDGGIQTVMFGASSIGSSISVDLATEYNVPSPIHQKYFKPMKDTQFVTIGPNGGVGEIMGWRVPSLIVWWVKSRDMFMSRGPGSVRGADVTKP